MSHGTHHIGSVNKPYGWKSPLCFDFYIFLKFHPIFFQKIFSEYYNPVKRVALIFGIITFAVLNIFVINQYWDENKTLDTPTALPYRRQSPDYEIALAYHHLASFSMCFG